MMLKKPKRAELTANEYQRLAMRTAPSQDRMAMLNHSVLGVTAEAGELAGIYQKEWQGHEANVDHVVKECGDILWMVAEHLAGYNITLEYCMMQNLVKLAKRYPDGFDPEKSLHRKPGDI